MKVYQELAALMIARQNCLKFNNVEWADRHTEAIHRVMETAPHGSGLDVGIAIVFTGREAHKELRFRTSFHHMNVIGMYDGWTDHDIVITPSFSEIGYDMRVTGPNRNQIKEYLEEVIDYWLTREYEAQ